MDVIVKDKNFRLLNSKISLPTLENFYSKVMSEQQEICAIFLTLLLNTFMSIEKNKDSD